MDKADFIKLAPVYYELAVLVAVWQSQGHLSEESICKEYEVSTHDDDPDPETLLGSSVLLKRALLRLEARNVITVLDDPFGPTLYTRAEGISKYIEELEADTSSPFYKSSRAPQRTRWIFNALSRMNRVYNELAVTEHELDRPDEDWEPIPLDRASPTVEKAIEAVDETVKQVEQSNGYHSEYPEERKYVLGNLKMLSDTLKTAATTSIGYIKNHGLAVLGKLQIRFGEAMIGEAAKEAGKALWNLIKDAIKSIGP